MITAVMSAVYTVILTVILQNPLSDGTLPSPEEIRLTVDTQGIDDLTLPFQCQRYGQKLAMEWLQEHPGYRLVKWRCPRPGSNEQGA